MVTMKNTHFCDVTSCSLVEVRFKLVEFEVFTVMAMKSDMV
jgi:hypothetical protein